MTLHSLVPHTNAHYQSIPPALLHNLLHSLYPDLTPVISTLQKDLHTLHSHQILPGIPAEQDLDSLLTPSLILALNSTRLISQTISSLTRILLQALAQQQKISLHDYLTQLHHNIQNAPHDWQQQSSLPSRIQSLLTQNQLSPQPPSTPDQLAQTDPLLNQTLQAQIKEISQSIKSPQQDAHSLFQIIFDHCLTILPALWPDHAEPDQIISIALCDLNLPHTTTESKDNAIHHDRIHGLFTSGTPLPEDSLLLESLTIISRKFPHTILPLLTKHIHQQSFLNRIETRSIQLQTRLLSILAPQPTTLLHALISRIKSLPTSPSEKTLWRRALHSISELHPHQLSPQHTILHFLSQDSLAPKEHAQNLLQIQSSRRRTGDARLDTLLHRLATGDDQSDTIHQIWPDLQTARAETQNRLAQHDTNFSPSEFTRLVELLLAVSPLQPLIHDLSDTLTAIAVYKQQPLDLSPLISPLLQDSIQPQELVSQLLQSVASQYDSTPSLFAQDNWPLIQDLSSTYQDPQTLTVLHQTITTLIPEREISLPQLPGSSQTVFETIPIDTKLPPSPSTDSAEDTTPLVDEIDREVWIVENAGLVVFAPYIEMLFERADLLRNKRFPSTEHATRGIFLLHYLVSGQSQAEEHQLLLNRVLCNLPLNHALPLSVDSGDNWQELTTGLINAVIHHWSTLGNTSPDSLLSTFIKREGSLRFDKEEGWSLHIPEGPYDMLLTSLPWAISTIHLPWMDLPLRVEWK